MVVPSPPIFGKGWPNHELGLVTREVAGNRQLILPVWDKVTKVGVIGYSRSLAGKVARSTADVSIDELADEIAGVVRPAKGPRGVDAHLEWRQVGGRNPSGGVSAFGETIDACALDRDPDISGIRALNSCRARHRLPGLSVRMGSRSVTG